MIRARSPTVLLALSAVVAIVAAGAIGNVLGHRKHNEVFTAGPGIAYATPADGTAWYGTTNAATRNPNAVATTCQPVCSGPTQRA